MKHCLRIVTGTLAVLIMLSAVAGCAVPEDPPPVNTPEIQAGRFNEGKVEYSVKENVTYADPFPEDLLGTVVSEETAGVITLYDEDFDDGDVSCGNTAVMFDKTRCGIADGKLYVSYSGDAGAPFGSGWSTWAPDCDCFSDEYIGAQISFDADLYSEGGSAWMAPFFGLFKNDFTTIPDNPSGGIYFSLNRITNRIYVYCSDTDNWRWPEGNCSVKLEDGLPEGAIHVDIVTAGKQNARIFISGKIVLELQLDAEKGTYAVLDAKGKQVREGAFDPELAEGSFFQFFTHLGSIGVDCLKIYGLSKGTRKVERIIEANPVDGGRLGLDITSKKDLVSICYSVWHNAINGHGTGPVKNVSDVEEMLKTHYFTAEKGFVNKETGEQNNKLTKFHYWGKPAQGYYRSSDVSAIRNNMTNIYNAGVDFIIIDLTFATSPGYDPGTSAWNDYIDSSVTPLLDTVMAMRAEGLGTPYVVFWMGDDSLFETMDGHFLSVKKWEDCFVYWNGKPFIMKWTFDGKEYAKWTVRGMYGLQGRTSPGQWSYLEIDNSKTVSYDANGEPEHMCADVATQETYMSVSTAHGRQGGRFFYDQWKNVFGVRPKIVTVTWWNEWCAQLYYVDGVGYIFTDNFNEEYSRDIEPQDGGHGDLYYKWLCGYVNAYKAHRKCPELVSE